MHGRGKYYCLGACPARTAHGFASAKQFRKGGERMMPARSLPVLIDRLPVIRGRYEENVPLAKHTWFRVGGPADVLFHPADEADLQTFLLAKPDDVAVTIIGVGSNMLVRDGGIRGVVVRLGRAFAQIEVEGMTVTAGAGATEEAPCDKELAKTIAKADDLELR